MKKKIEIGKTKVKAIADAVGVTPTMVYIALRYESDSKISKRIREIAKKEGEKRCIAFMRMNWKTLITNRDDEHY